MNIGGYKSSNITQDLFTDWDQILADKASQFWNPERLNPAYDTLCYNVEDAEKYN